MCEFLSTLCKGSGKKTMEEHVCWDEWEHLLTSSFSSAQCGIDITFLKTWATLAVWIANAGCYQNSLLCLFTLALNPIVIPKYSVIVCRWRGAGHWEGACFMHKGRGWGPLGGLMLADTHTHSSLISGRSDCWTDMLQNAPSVTVPPLYLLCFSLQLQPCCFLPLPQCSQCTWQHKQ